MTHVRQPLGSNLCAHACLAMMLGLTLDQACERMGHRRKTRTRDLVRALGPVALAKRLLLVRQVGLDHLPDDAVLRIVWGSFGHFVVKHGERVHDPAWSDAERIENWLWKVAEAGWRLTAYLPVRLAP